MKVERTYRSNIKNGNETAKIANLFLDVENRRLTVFMPDGTYKVISDTKSINEYQNSIIDFKTQAEIDALEPADADRYCLTDGDHIYDIIEYDLGLEEWIHTIPTEGMAFTLDLDDNIYIYDDILHWIVLPITIAEGQVMLAHLNVEVTDKIKADIDEGLYFEIEVGDVDGLIAGGFVHIFQDLYGKALVKRADDGDYKVLKAEGYVKSDYEIGDIAKVYFDGINDQVPVFLIPNEKGKDMYLAQGGNVTGYPILDTGNIVQKLGVALSNTAMIVNIQQPITLV